MKIKLIKNKYFVQLEMHNTSFKPRKGQILIILKSCAMIKLS